MTTPHSRRTFALVALLAVAVTLGLVIARLSAVGGERGSTAPLAPPAPQASTEAAALRDAPSSGREELAAIVSAAEPEASLEAGAAADAALEVEPWKAFRLQELEDRWESVQAVLEAGSFDPFNSVSFLVQISVRPCADAMGLGTPLPEGVRHEVEHLPGTHYMSVGTIEYQVPNGLFPAVDTFMQTWQEINDETDQARQAAFEQGLLPPPRRFFPVDETFLRDLEALKEQARLALLARRDAY